MAPKLKAFLLFSLLVPCWIIAAQYDIDLVNLYKVSEFSKIDLSLVYAYNGLLGRFFYGPVSLILLWPLSWMSYEEAKWVWIVLQTLSYGIFWYCLYKLYPLLSERTIFWGWLVVFILSINPIHNNYQSNNVQLMIMAALVAAEVWTQSTKEWQQVLAGVLVAVVASVKVFPFFLVVYYYLTRNRAVREGLLLGCALCILAPMLFFGYEETTLLFKNFLGGLGTYEADNSLTGREDILCLPSLISRWLPPSIAPLVTKISILGISGVFFAWAWWTERKSTDPRVKIHSWALACALTAFLNPSTRPHYFILYVPAAASVLEVIYATQSKRLMTAGLVVATLLIAFTVEGVVGKELNNKMEAFSLPTYGFLVLTIVLMVALRKRLATVPAVLPTSV